MTVVIGNKDNFKSEVMESESPVIVDFYADWCGPCQMMKPVFEELSDEYNGKVKFVKIDTEADQELANEFEIRGIPCLITFKGGKEANRLVGFSAKDVLKDKVDDLL